MIDKDCGWGLPRTPAVRWLRDERAAGAVLEHQSRMQDVRQGSVRASGAGRGGGGREPGIRRGRGGAGPTLGFTFLCSADREAGDWG